MPQMQHIGKYLQYKMKVKISWKGFTTLVFTELRHFHAVLVMPTNIQKGLVDSRHQRAQSLKLEALVVRLLSLHCGGL
ncbi:hypothetical protein CKO18_05800 [Rhodoferax fermentans]|uniref:Uncharacterized protein n=1 Tax=Rhodoferax fermentans TaxID=28066 RepID=A0A1T1ATX5_RHOFE|nr:hypothetical protein [Rhodoferax fermentans]OOV07517.1 hypothetical protein RF819_12945 [Rhodoferax fermentans]OOV11101.1 hypothetical protein RF819_00060 [Rhodoferax fermentans]